MTFDTLVRGDIEFVPVDAVAEDDPAWVTRTALRRPEKRRRLLLMTAFVVLAVLIVAGMFLLWWSMQTPTEILGPDLPLDGAANDDTEL